MKQIFLGDIHGSYSGLKAILKEANYSSQDELWLVGDLVNRGKQSMDVLKFVYDLGDKAKVVLGNHDMHMLAVYYDARKQTKRDTFGDVLKDKNVDIYMQWLKSQAFVQHCDEKNLLMVHAGVYPGWDKTTALANAYALQDELTNTNNPKKLLSKLFNNMPDYWDPKLSNKKTLRTTLNITTRMRYVHKKEKQKHWHLDYQYKGSIDKAKGVSPWFKHVDKSFAETKIVFGHWSALGFYNHNNICCLDGGYLWGGRLIAMVVEDNKTNKAKFKSVSK